MPEAVGRIARTATNGRWFEVSIVRFTQPASADSDSECSSGSCSSWLELLCKSAAFFDAAKKHSDFIVA
jgi:hypothetical protein